MQRLDGGTLSPQVSPDGTKLLARRDPKRGETYLAVWTLGETEEERNAEKRRLEREAEILRDPEEVADRPEVPRRRAPKYRLPSVNGFAADNPRWMPDGERVLFARRAPDADGLLRLDLSVWNPSTGSVERVTRYADVAEADPAPRGMAVGGATATGASGGSSAWTCVGADAADPGRRAAEPWRVPGSTRACSPDGQTIAASSTRRPLAPRHASRAGGVPTEIAASRASAGPDRPGAPGSRIYVAADREGSEPSSRRYARTAGASQR